MKTVGMDSPPPISTKAIHSDVAKPNIGKADNIVNVEQNRVTLSAEGKALLESLKQIEKESKAAESEGVSDHLESFTHGALGMDHPDTIEEENDTSYSAGQYVSAAVTVGGILLALI